MRLNDLFINVISDDTLIPNWMARLVEIERQENPFYIFDLSDVIKKVDIWNTLLPRVKPYYAVKCNFDTVLLKLLAGMGLSFDCATQGEMELILSLGVDPKKIIFANPIKIESQITYAKENGIKITVFDSEEELIKTHRLFPKSHVVLRVRCDASNAQLLFGDKFGVKEQEVSALLQVVVSLGLNFAGVAFHVGTGCEEVDAYRRGIASARAIFDEAKTLGLRPYFLDIGGGFPGKKGTSIAREAKVINSALDEFFPDQSKVQVVAEPGRFYCSSAFTLGALVHSRRAVPPDSYFYFINEGVYSSFCGVITEKSEVIPRVLIRKDKEVPAPVTDCKVWGPTLDALDELCSNVPLPVMDVGDWLYFENMGAYTVAIVSEFHLLPKADVFYVVRESTWENMRNLLTALYGDCKFILNDSDNIQVIK